MGKHPRLEEFEKLMEAGAQISIDEKQYEAMTGRAMPKDNTYLTTSSALAKRCKVYGYQIVVSSRIINLCKAVI